MKVPSIPSLDKGQLLFLGICAAVAITVIVLLAVYWSKIKAYFTARRLEKSFEEQITPTEVTISQQQAQNIADKIYTAMDGAGTNETALYNAFEQINSYSDLMMVMKAFGKRKGSWSWFGGESGLVEWICNDCSNSEIAKINAILASKNIDFSF
jgi:hypothetical protein